MKKRLLHLLLFIFFIGFVCVAFVIYDGYQMYREAISKISLSDKVQFVQKQQHYTTLDQISPYSINAIVAVEDHRFFQHHGFDFAATANAFLYNLRTLSLARGGSTITQQLAKNLYFTQEKKFSRKIAELFVAFDLEKKYSKNTILELYLNTIYYGDGYYSIYDASHGYFDKDPIDLTLGQASLLAGIPNAPSIYSDRNYSALALQRQRQVLDSMVRYGYLSQKEADSIVGAS